MLGQFRYHLGGHVVASGLREVVNDDRQRRAVGYRAIKRKEVRGRHLLFVVMRSPYHGHVVAELGGVFGEPQGFDRRLDAGAGNQNFIGRSSIPREFQDIAALLIGEHDRLSSRAEHDNSGYRRTRVTLDVGLELFKIDVAVRIEGRGDGRKNAVEKHRQFYS